MISVSYMFSSVKSFFIFFGGGGTNSGPDAWPLSPTGYPCASLRQMLDAKTQE